MQDHIRLQRISTHTLRKEGDCYATKAPQAPEISTHTLRKEGDGASLIGAICETIFQPTPSARRVTSDLLSDSYSYAISTHTLRKEGDNSRAILDFLTQSFQPTPSARRVTDARRRLPHPEEISTHTLRKEGDLRGQPAASSRSYFNPHPPQGG